MEFESLRAHITESFGERQIRSLSGSDGRGDKNYEECLSYSEQER